MMLTDLADTLRAAGLQVVEEPGWRQRGHAGPRHTPGNFGVGLSGKPKTIVCHHTGGTKDLRVIINGRPGLDGPLANIWLAQDGTWHATAAGMCYHAGVVRDLSYANEWSIGIEAEATGTDPWPPVQYHSYAKGCAALSAHYGVPVDHVLGHKEVCDPPGRKTDPNFDMGEFRALVTRYRYELLHPAKPTTPQEDDVTREELCKILGLDPADPRITTGWQDDGTFDPNRPLRVTVARALAADRGASLHASAGVDQLAGRLVSLEQGLNTLTELVRALSAPPVAPGAGG